MKLAYKRLMAWSHVESFVASFDRTYRSAGRPTDMGMWVLAEAGSEMVQVACRVPESLDVELHFQDGWTLGPVMGEGWECRVGDDAREGLASVDAFDLVR